MVSFTQRRALGDRVEASDGSNVDDASRVWRGTVGDHRCTIEQLVRRGIQVLSWSEEGASSLTDVVGALGQEWSEGYGKVENALDVERENLVPAWSLRHVIVWSSPSTEDHQKAGMTRQGWSGL